MSKYGFFSKDPGHWGKSYQSLWGYHDICPLLEQFHIAHMTQLELASLTYLNAWGDPQKFCSNVPFLLVVPKEGAVGERVYGLTMVWVQPYQARVSLIDDMAKQLTQLASTGPNRCYAWCSSTGTSAMCPSLHRVTWVLWWRGIPAMSLVEGSTNWRFTDFWAQASGWFTQLGSTGVKFQW